MDPIVPVVNKFSEYGPVWMAFALTTACFLFAAWRIYIRMADQLDKNATKNQEIIDRQNQALEGLVTRSNNVIEKVGESLSQFSHRILSLEKDLTKFTENFEERRKS